MDKAIADAPRAHRGAPGQNRGGGGGGRSGNSAPGPTARRKLIHAFRTFLSAEEEFFRTLIGRLAATGLGPGDVEGLRGLGVVVDLVDPATGRDWNWSEEERRQRRAATVPLAHKALICFGDLARYRELYNEPGLPSTNPITGGGRKESANGRRGGRGGGRDKPDPAERKPKNWTRAGECYEQARLLLPDNGNPSNQLAVLSQYGGDTLSSTYHYYRALAVKQPFATARANLDIMYAKQLSRWFGPEGGEDHVDGDEGAKFKATFVVLHAVFLKARVADITPLASRSRGLFTIAIEQRLLSSEVIVKIVVTALCALWNARMFRSPDKKTSERKSASSKSPTPASLAVVEPFLLLHVLSLYRTLLLVGGAETAELVESNVSSQIDTSTDDTLALNISAVLRRTLPALRILSKWVSGQLDYIQRVQGRVAEQQASSMSAGVQAEGITQAELARGLNNFWRAYASFGTALGSAFPPARLPCAGAGGVWLEEDVDLLGFAPLKRGLKEGAESTDGGSLEIARVGTDVHPNEEQLMRIADIQHDALVVVDSVASPIKLKSGALIADVPTPESPPPPPPLPPPLEPLQVPNGPNNYGVQIDSEVCDDPGGLYGDGMTDDDPVDLAMRISAVDRLEMNTEDGEDDDDQLGYGSLAGSGHLLHPTSSRLASPARNALLPPSAAPAHSRNASDVLLQTLNGGSGAGFGQGSIWTSPDARHTPPAPVKLTRDSFEALPNTTAHSHLASAFAPPSQSSALWGAGSYPHFNGGGFGASHDPLPPPQQQPYQPQQNHYLNQQLSNQYGAPQPPFATSLSSLSAASTAFTPYGAPAPPPPNLTRQLPPSAPPSWGQQPNASASAGRNNKFAQHAGYGFDGYEA